MEVRAGIEPAHLDFADRSVPTSPPHQILEINMPFREDLQCDVIRLEYDFQAHRGRLIMPDGNCCDMDGCITLFEAIDPGVKQIETYAGEQQDTSYMNDRGGKWHAVSAPE